MSADEVLFQNEYLSVRLEHHGKLVRVTRSAKIIADPQIVQLAYDPIIAVLDRIGRSGRCLLSDVRLAPGRNDPAFEEVFSQVRARMMRGFDRIGTLVQTKVGMLQLHRHIREDKVERIASSDEQELLACFGLKP